MEEATVSARRMNRLNDQIRDELADLLARETRDPRLYDAIISITGVETAPDLSSARIFVSVLGSKEEAEETFKHIELAARLNLRHTPELDFRLDRSIAEGARIEELLRGLNNE